MIKKIKDLLPVFVVIGLICVGFFLKHLNDVDVADEAKRAAIIAKNTITSTVVQSIPIYSLSLNNEISGKMSGSEDGIFVLGFGGLSGSISGELGNKTLYYFYKDSESGGIILSKVDAESTPLVKSNKVPHLEITVKVTKQFYATIASQVVSQKLFVPVNYKLLGDFKK